MGCKVRRGNNAYLMLSTSLFGINVYMKQLICLFVCLFQRLPQFPLPTHDVVNRGTVPVNFYVSVYNLVLFNVASKFLYSYRLFNELGL